MRSTTRFRQTSLATALAAACAILLGASASVAATAEGVKTVSLVPTSTPENRNNADPRSFSDSVPARPVERGDISVTVDRAKIIRLPERTQTVVIGNSAVADVAVQKSGVVVLTGKSFGVTNFLALDAAGNLVAETNVSVKAPTDATLVVYRAADRFTYSCTPVCQPTVALGDAGAYFGEVKGQADAHSAFAGSR